MSKLVATNGVNWCNPDIATGEWCSPKGHRCLIPKMELKEATQVYLTGEVFVCDCGRKYILDIDYSSLHYVRDLDGFIFRNVTRKRKYKNV